MHAVEWAWLARVRATRLYRYEFDAAAFQPYDRAAGYLVSTEPVRPLAVQPFGDPLAAHAEAGIELRLVASLWPLADLVPASGLEFSMIRMHNARRAASSGIDDVEFPHSR